MIRTRIGLVGRLALTMGAIAVTAVAISMALVYHALDGRLNGLGEAHVQSSAERISAIAADRYRAGGWSPAVVRDLSERSSVAGFQIEVTDPRGRPLEPSPGRTRPHRWTAHAPVVVDGRTVGQLSLRPTRDDIFGLENRALHNQLNSLLEVCAALALGLAMLAAALVATTLVRPLRRLTDTAERMSHGDLGARARAGGGAELNRLADTFNRLASTLAREDEVRRAAAADIAHELRTPVTGIVSRIEAAQDGVMADEAANLEAMHAEALRLAGLIDDVAQLAEAERPDLLVAREPVDLAEVCALRAAAYDGFFEAKGIAFAARREPAPMQGDPRRLEQVVDNLLSNALRYTDPGGHVELHVRREDGRCLVEVRDTGMGISAEDLPHVFERFYRASDARGLPGSGLGLAIVRQTAQRHGGSVSAGRTPQGGAIFRLTLPRAPDLTRTLGTSPGTS
jgi:two-component system, OmpR family, sensor histidine kinase BaeS